MTTTDSGSTVIAFIGNYLPGYNSGGIARSMINTVDHLGDEFRFLIVTRDRDIGDERAYPDIHLEEWQRVGNSMVWYVPPQSLNPSGIERIINATPHGSIYLGSFFDPFTIYVLLLKKLGRIKSDRVIVAPRGEFGWGSLRLKYPKKLVFMAAARLIGLYNGVVWHASTAEEARDIARIMKVSPSDIHVALDLPAKADAEAAGTAQLPSPAGELRVVFLGRVAREKNLDYALDVIARTKSKITFDIYGPLTDAKYWEECQRLIARMPDAVTVRYLGGVNPGDVLNVLGSYDVLFLPTSGENYGHVIAESLAAGTPVLLSTESPWRNLAAEGLGWDLDLGDSAAFVRMLDSLASGEGKPSPEQRAAIRRKAEQRLTDPRVVEANRALFR